MKVVFFGTPDFVVPVVEKIYKELSTSFDKSVVAVVTQPPKPSGRDKKITLSPVDEWAYRKKIPIILDKNLAPQADLAVVAAYGEIIPEKVITKYRLGVINIHPSLLPKWRGASPIQASIIANSDFGVSFIKMDELMDHGKIISSFKYSYNGETATEVTKKIFERAAEALVELIPNYINNRIKLTEQDHNHASFCMKLTKQDGFIPASIIKNLLSGEEISDKWDVRFMSEYEMEVNCQSVIHFIKAMNEWPMAWTKVKIKNEEKILKIISAHQMENNLVIDEVQLEGKNVVSWEQFMQGYPEYKLE